MNIISLDSDIALPSVTGFSVVVVVMGLNFAT